MADETQAQAEPSSATAAATPAAETTTSQPDTSNMSLEQLNQLFEKGSVELPAVEASGEEGKKADETPVEEPAKPEKKEEPATTVEKPASEKPPETTPEATVETPTEEAAKPETTPPDPETEEVERIQRPRLKNPVDQQIAAVFKAAEASGTPISWTEAERRVKGDPPAKATEAAPTPEPDLKAVVTTLSTEVDAIKARLTELGADEGLYNAEIAKLQIELPDKLADLKLAQRDLKEAAKRAEQEEAQTRTESEKNRTRARQIAVERWPDAGDDSTPLGKAVAKRIAEMKSPKHPDHAILYADNAPLAIVRDVADELGIAAKVVAKPAAPPPPTTTQTPPATPPKKVVSPASGARTSVQPAKPAEDAKQTFEYLRNDASLEELDKFFGAGDEASNLAALARVA